MSPMPIREAVRRLDAAGLVENIPHRGARVTELSVTDLAEVYEARMALEVLAIRRAAERFERRRRGSRPAAPAYFGGDDRRQDRRGLRRARRVSLRAVRRRRLGVAAAADPAGVGDQRALLPGGAGVPAAQAADAGSTARSSSRASRMTRTSPRSRCTTTWRRPRTTSRRRWEARLCSSSGADGEIFSDGEAIAHHLYGSLDWGAGARRRALYAYDHSHRNKIAHGVAVAGIDVGGLTAAQARARLRREYLPRFEQPVVVRFHAHRFKLSPRAAHVTVDVNGAVDEALARSRGGSIFTRVSRALTGGSVDADIQPQVTYSHAAVARLVGRVKRTVDRPARDASVSYAAASTGNGAVADRPGGQDRGAGGRRQRRARAPRAVAGRSRSARP